MRLSTTALTLLLTATALAQQPIVLPAEYADAWGRGSGSALGGSSTRTQMIFAQPFALGTPVFGVGLRPAASTNDRAPFTADLEIRMSSTANAPGALNSTFAQNVGSDMVVAFPRQSVNIQAMPANRSTAQFATFPFQAPFLFGTNSNPNINVDLLVYSRSTGASWSTDRGFAAVNGRATTAGRGCGSGTISSSSTGRYVAGSTLTIGLANATPNSGAILIPSIDMSELFPGLPLPFSLTAFGAPAGCDLLVSTLLGPITLPTDGSGAASIALPIPSGVGQIGTGWQWAYMVPPSAANPIGLETTANRAIWIGPEVIVPGAQYVWDLFDVNSATGMATTDSVPIVQFMIP